jgi:hypothetical protein
LYLTDRGENLWLSRAKRFPYFVSSWAFIFPLLLIIIYDQIDKVSKALKTVEYIPMDTIVLLFLFQKHIKPS